MILKNFWRKNIIFFSCLFFGLFLYSDSALAQVVYNDLVTIPYMTGTSATDYLSGLYTFLTRVVGIVAMGAIVIGGARYLTSVGNPSAIEDAKHTINSAIIGLILAISSWVIVTEINPEITVLKNPTMGVAAVGTYTSTPASENKCVKNMTGDGHAGNPCLCIDGFPALGTAAALALSGNQCNDICSDKTKSTDNKSHCLVVDARMGSFSNTDVMTYTIDELRDRSVTDGTRVSPFLMDPDGCNPLLEGEKFSTVFYGPPTYDWDANSDGVYDGTNVPFIAACFANYAQVVSHTGGFTNCYTTTTPKAEICPIMFKITDNAIPPNMKEDTIYWGYRAP